MKNKETIDCTQKEFDRIDKEFDRIYDMAYISGLRDGVVYSLAVLITLIGIFIALVILSWYA